MTRAVVLTRSLTMEPGGYGITVNAVAPRLTVTDTIRERFPAELLTDQLEQRAIERDEMRSPW